MFNIMEVDYQDDEITLRDKNKTTSISFYKVPDGFKSHYMKYIKFELSRKEFSTAYITNTNINNFWNFISLNKVESFESINGNIFTNFLAYLSTTLNAKNKPFSESTKDSIFISVKKMLIYVSNEFNLFDVSFIPSSSPFKRKRYSESIPEPMIKGIKKNILKYPNLHVKVFVLLGLNYGMRYSEVINLNGFCLKENELNPKRKDLYFYSPKIKKYRTLYSIENLVSLHIQTLIDESQENREHYNIDSIFIKKCNTKLGYSIPTNNSINIAINKFLKKYNIKHPNGSFLRISTHSFRRTIPESYDKKGVNIFIAKDVLGHKSIATTRKFYDKTNEFEYQKTMLEAIKKINVLADIKKSKNKNLSKNPNKYKIIEEGYCTNNDTVESKKLCPYLKARGNCYGCPSMITTPEYLPFFKEQLINTRNELKNVQKFGVDVARHYEWKEGIIIEIIKKLEVLNVTQ